MTPAAYPLALALSILSAPPGVLPSGSTAPARPPGTACRESIYAPHTTQCNVVGGIACMEGEYSANFTKVMYDSKEESAFFVYSSTMIFHEDDPDTRLQVSDIFGRYVERCITHDESPVIAIGGMSPRDWAFAKAQEDWAWDVAYIGPLTGRIPSYPDVLVKVGLGSDRYQTRRAAHRVLVGMGRNAIGACFRGLRSFDAEVRERCGLILYEVRYGSLSMMGGER